MPIIGTSTSIGALSRGVNGQPPTVNQSYTIAPDANTTFLGSNTSTAQINLPSTNRPSTLSGRIWTAFDTSNDIVPDVKQRITEAIWSTGTGSLKLFYTASAQSASSGDYYYDVYHLNPSADTTAAVQFAISYGHRLGSGSNDISDSSNIAGLTPSRAIYSQYRNLLLTPSVEQFTLYNNKAIDSAVFITFNRARYKEKIDAGNWEITLSGSNGTLTTLIDNYVPTNTTTVSEGGEKFDIVSGSLSNGIYNSSAPVYFGSVYPEMGIIMIDGDMLTDSASVTIATSSLTDCNNHGHVLSAISGAAVLSTANVDYGFQARNEQEITSTYYFVRIKNGEYNFSNNSTFSSGSQGDLRFSEMWDDPRVYITTVGLYDNYNQLLAVAKLSKPLQKSFSREALLRIKLDY